MCLLHLQERILTFFYLVDSMGKWMSKEKPVMNAGESSKVWNKNPIVSLLCTTPVWKRAQSLQEEDEDIRAQTTTESRLHKNCNQKPSADLTTTQVAALHRQILVSSSSSPDSCFPPLLVQILVSSSSSPDSCFPPLLVQILVFSSSSPDSCFLLNFF